MEISDAWERTAPPVHITTLMIARGLGAGGSGTGPGPMPEIQEANAETFAAFLGQGGELPAYARPKKGLDLAG